VEEGGLRLPLTVVRFAFGELFDTAGGFEETKGFLSSCGLSCIASIPQVSGPGQSSQQQDGQGGRPRLRRSTLTQASGSEQLKLKQMRHLRTVLFGRLEEFPEDWEF